ncbi:hypothetical protein [uncultured Bacteroides sp.]|uniref:hypothetical protein n=1 Tax=uncultured Bacteroides sp. TaxID=162156 RepID=UPI002AA6CED6|nr:hypothetical protein [uncultured Bacteroides sp.]
MKQLFIVSSMRCYADNIGHVVDTTKYVFILDEKIVSAKYIDEHLDAIEWIITADSVREAVFITAGEYRTPFHMFRTRKREGVSK